MTNLLTILIWFTTKKKYLAQYGNENKNEAAKKLWHTIDSYEWVPFIMMILLTCVICYYYYFAFNNKPNRHYLPKYQRLFGIGALLSTFLITLGFFYIIAKNPSFDIKLLVGAAGINTLYSAVCYIVLSCLFIISGKSNAYPGLF